MGRKRRRSPQTARVYIPFVGAGAGPAASHGLLGLGGMADSGVSSVGGFPFLVLDFLCVFFRMVWWWRHPEVRLRSFPPYPRSDGVSSTGGGHMELFV
jgi:hypothetical protein